jgi:hypothetical protein
VKVSHEASSSRNERHARQGLWNQNKDWFLARISKYKFRAKGPAHVTVSLVQTALGSDVMIISARTAEDERMWGFENEADLLTFLARFVGTIRT